MGVVNLAVRGDNASSSRVSEKDSIYDYGSNYREVWSGAYLRGEVDQRRVLSYAVDNVNRESADTTLFCVIEILNTPVTRSDGGLNEGSMRRC